MNSRLLHAAARGARIQAHDCNNRWITVTYAILIGQLDLYRIHPKDAHLEYGPISMALREAAEHDRPCAFCDVPNIAILTDAAYKLNGLERALFLLILAEALADEGL
jgi:hypothetical protein